MIDFISTRALAGLAAGAAVGLVAAISHSQPTSNSPLAPPPNGPRQTTPASASAALTNVTLHAKPGQTIEHATVVVRDGVIVGVGAGVQPPAGAEARDCTGLHVYAGFIEPFLELEVPRPDVNAPGSHWNTRVTPQRSALDKGASGVDKKTGETLREMGFTAAAISPRGGIFRGTSAVVSLAEISNDPSAVTPRVYKDRSYHALSIDLERAPRGERGEARADVSRWSTYPDSQMGVIAVLRQTLSDADWLQAQRRAGTTTEPVGALDALFREQTGERSANRSGTGAGDARTARWSRTETPLLIDTADELDALRADSVAREFNRDAVLLGSGMEFRRLAAIVQTGRPVVIPLNYPQTPKVGTIGEAESVELRELINWEQAPTNPRRLDEAGVMTAFTTSKIPDKRGGRRAFTERLSGAIKHGLTPDAALAMLTTNAAEVLGVGEMMGTVETGKAANLILCDGPLFMDKPDAPKKGEDGYIRPARILDVYIDGRRHIVNAPSRRDLVGVWEVTVNPAPGGNNARITLEIDDEAPPGVTIVKRTTGEDGKEQRATSKAKDASFDDSSAGGRFRFTFDHEPFGMKGVFVSSGVIEKSADGAPVMLADAMRSDGQPFSWTARRTSTELPKRPRPPEGAGRRERPEGAAEAAPAQADDKVAEGAQPQNSTPPQRPGAAEPRKSKTPEADAVAQIPAKLGLPLGPFAYDGLPPQETVVITGATVWTCGPAGVIENGVVVISGGKIAAVGGTGAVAVPTGDGVRVVDARGKHVSPGIIDCHSHTGISKGVNEGGQAVTAEVRIQDVTDPDSISWYRQLGGGVTAVNNLHGSANAIGGQNCVNKNRWGCATPEDMHFAGAMPGIKFALGENPKWSNAGDRNTTRYPQTRMGVETLIRDRFTAAREYLEATKGRGAPSLPVRRDLELEALSEIIEGKRLVHCHSYRQDEILMLCRIADEFGFKIGTFQHGLEVYKVADEVKSHAIGASIFSDWWAYKMEVQDAIAYAGPLQTEVGVLTSYNSDSDELARRLNVEAGKAVKYSHGKITPQEALKFVTLNPAKQLRIDDRVGSIEAGKDADIAVWSGPPTSSLSRCERTFVDGREEFSLERDASLRAAAGAERARIIQKILAQSITPRPGAGAGGRGGRPGRGDTDEKEPGSPDAEPPAPTELADADTIEREARSGGRRLMLMDMQRQAEDARREYYLWMYRRGFDTRFHDRGWCGCEW